MPTISAYAPHVPPDSETRRVHEAFTLLLRWAQRGDVRRALLGDAAPVLSPSDITLLRTIAAHGPVRASDLASWRGVDKSTVTPRIHRLENHHLVARRGAGCRRCAPGPDGDDWTEPSGLTSPAALDLAYPRPSS